MEGEGAVMAMEAMEAMEERVGQRVGQVMEVEERLG